MRGRSSIAWCLARVGALGSLLLPGACATGQYSYISDTEAGRRTAAERAEALEVSSPNLIVAGGNALLPGSRFDRGADLLAVSSPTVSAPLATPGVSLLGSHRLLGLGGGPVGLLSVHGGASAGGGALGAGLSVAGAATALQVELTNSSLAVGAAPVGGGASLPPPIPIAFTVPGATPVTTLIHSLPLPLGLLGH